MIHVGIVDDNAEFQNLLSGITAKYFGEKNIACKVESYQSPVFFCDEVIENQSYDICFLDIEMPEMNGIELARKLRRQGSNVELVFMTSHAEYVRNGYEVKAFDYMDKATAEREIPKMMERLLVHLEDKRKREYIIENSFRLEKFPYEDIIYICKRGKYSQFILKNGEEKQERKPLRDVLIKLACDDFMLVEKGFIINIGHVNRFHDGAVQMSDGEEIRVGRRYTNELKKKIKECWSRRR